MPTPEEDHALVAALSIALATRPDAERARALLGDALVAHIDDLWPDGAADDAAPWLRANVDGVLASIERLYAAAIEGDAPVASEFLARMAWLPALARDIAELGQPACNFSDAPRRQ
jgi:hypothetical protein